VASDRLATVEGPITGSRRPWGHPGPEVEQAGYLVEEFQIHGATVAYAPVAGTTEGPDGRWQAEVRGEASYRTRLLVARPREPADFNGTVLLHWQNVSAGVESPAPPGGEAYRGYAWVGVSAQEVGVFGFPMGVGIRRGAGYPQALPLVDHDPERYGTLRHPGDEGSFDIFTQAARVVGPHRAGDVDPLAGLQVRRVLALGGSQSAMRLATYANAVQPLEHALDGFLLSVWEGKGPSLLDGSISFGGRRTTIRSDLETPVMVVNSEFEAVNTWATGIEDTRFVRVWEVAGAPHGVASGGASPGGANGWVVNRLSIGPVHQAAVRRLHEWVSGGRAAPAQPRIAMDVGRPPEIRRDELGNAVGGIRLPEIAVPTAEHRGMSFGTGRAPLFGASRPFPAEVIADMYPTAKVFRDRWREAVEALLKSGALLEEDAAAMTARAEGVDLQGSSRAVNP
jgi:hypothetical protein